MRKDPTAQLSGSQNYDSRLPGTSMSAVLEASKFSNVKSADSQLVAVSETRDFENRETYGRKL